MAQQQNNEATVQSTTRKRNGNHARWGHTLIELVVVSAAATVLMGGLASALYIASQSLNVGSGSLAGTRTARQALAEMNRDLQSASGLSELTATSVTMTVPDRDGDNVPETIRYAWSGIAGDPLTQSYNSGIVTNLATNVQAFALDAQTRFIDGIANGQLVIFVSAQAPDGDGGLATPSPADQDRIDLIENWGYDVTVISQQATLAELNAELENALAVYVSGDCTGATLGTKLNDATIGVVTESHSHGQQLGLFSGGSVLSQSSNHIHITDTNHYVLAGMTVGNLVVTTANQTRYYTTGTLAPGNIKLADFSSSLSEPVLQVIDAGDELSTGSAAAGHRCLLPWGDNGFDSTTLNSDGQTIMRRAIEWAAGTPFIPNQVVFESFEEAKVTGSKNVTINTPNSTAENDLLIAAIAVDGNATASIAPPAGWTPLSMGQSLNSVTFAVYWKLADVTEPSNHTFTWANNESAYGWIMRFTGHDPNHPINDFTNQIGSATILTPATFPAVTSSVSHVKVLRLGGFDGNLIVVPPPIASHSTITMDASGANDSSDVSGGAGYQYQKVAGSSGIANFSIELSVLPRAFNTISIAIAPDPNLDP